MDPKWEMQVSFGNWMTVRKALAGLDISADDIQDSTSRMKIKNLYVENIQADNLNFEEFDLDDLPDGTNYQRAKSASLDADGLIILDEVYIDGEAGTYALIERTDLSAGHLLLSSVVQSESYRTVTDDNKTAWNGKPDDMDEIGDGATYKKVLATHIDAGKIKLSSITTVDGTFTTDLVTEGAGNKYDTGAPPANLDALGDGATYKRVLATDISAGHINLTADFLINGVSQTTAGVWIDATDGITIKGGKMKFVSPDGEESHTLYEDNDGYLRVGIIGADKFNMCLPDVSDSRYCGTAGAYWGYGYFNYLRYKDIDTFDVHDDVGMIKAMRPDPKNPQKIDRATIPVELFGEAGPDEIVIGEPMLDLGKSLGLLFGAFRQMDERLRKVETI